MRVIRASVRSQSWGPKGMDTLWDGRTRAADMRGAREVGAIVGRVPETLTGLGAGAERTSLFQCQHGQVQGVQTVRHGRSPRSD